MRITPVNAIPMPPKIDGSRTAHASSVPPTASFDKAQSTTGRPRTGAAPQGLAGAPKARASSASGMRPRTPLQTQSHHGNKAHASEQMAREVLESVPLGQLKSEFSPELLHVVHSAAYAPDDQYSSLKGKLSAGYALAWAGGKDKIEPAQIRESWAAAPGGLGVRTYQPEEIGKLESYGASFWGLPLPGSSGPAGTLTGKTVFRPAESIPQDLQRLCGEVKKRLRQAKGNDRMEAALIAAHFKQNFIAIHPYMDGNGRVSRLCADRILKELGVPAPDWGKADFDLNLSIEETAQLMVKHMG